MEKRIYTKAYLMLDKGIKVSEIKKKIKEYYGVNINQGDIMKWFPGVKKNHNEIPEGTKRLVLHLYEEWPNTDKVIEYMEKYHNFHITNPNLRVLANRHGIKKKKRALYAQSKVSFSEEKTMLQMYRKGLRAEEIADHFGYKTTKSIYNKIEKFGKTTGEIRKNELHNGKPYGAFSMKCIDSPEKAYFLGLLLTDGSVNPEKTFIELSLIDEDAISFLANYIGCTYNSYKRTKGQEQHRIVLYGEQLLEDLFHKQVRPNKTYNLQGPLLSKEEMEYLPYLMRGIVDGDGWIRSDGKEFFICSASYDFILWCKAALEHLGMVSLRISKGPHGIHQIRSGSKKNISVLQKIYAEVFGMKRKRKRIKEGCSETIIETPILEMV